MKKINKKIFFAFALVIILFFSLLPLSFQSKHLNVNFSYALEISNYPSFGNLSITSSSNLIDYIKYFYNFGMAIGVSLAILVITFGGLLYLLASLRNSLTGNAKEWIKSGIIGLLILLSVYIIVFTINPSLAYFKLDRLFSTGPAAVPTANKNPNNLPAVSYDEIPIGTLTEDLLSRTMYCYDFDPQGNPLPLVLQTDKDGQVQGPTYRNHDRVDCLLKLTDAAQKKAKEISDLAQQLKKMMEKCDCAGKCDDPCNKNGKGCQLSGNKCVGACKGAACAQPNGTQSCCEPAEKQKIEHGPIKIECNTQEMGVNVEPDFQDPSFENPSDPNSNQCTVGSLDAVLKSPITLILDSKVDRAAVQWAIDQWNAAVGYNIFKNITVSDRLANSYCFYGYDNSCTGSSKVPPPNGTFRIVDKPIDTKGKIAWQPAAFNNYSTQSGAMLRADIDMDSNNPDIASGQSYKMTILHELGHTLGLDDSYDKDSGKANPDCNYKSVMNNQFIMDAVGASDKQELQTLYGGGAGAWLSNPYFAALSQNSLLSWMTNGTNKNPVILAQFLPPGICNCGNGKPPAASCCQTGDGGGGNVATCFCIDGTATIACCTDPNQCFCSNGTTSPTCCGTTGTGGPGGVGGQCTICGNKSKTYKGLDEFRGQVTSVADQIEKKVQVEKQDVLVINIDGRQGINTPKKWNDLKLMEQLNYLKEKIQQIEKNIKDDVTKLDNARSSLASCSNAYSARSFANMASIVETTDKLKKIITVQKPFASTTPGTDVDSSKYCKGFNYSYSSGYKICQQECPDSSEQSLNCYAGCNTCQPGDKNCFANQQKCIDKCFNERPCLFGPSSGKKFQDCITTYQNSCSDFCSKKYLPCSDDYKLCTSLCKQDSKCLLDNQDKCLIDSNSFQNCGAQKSNPANYKNCVESSYLCEYGSNENAGYPDCLSTYFQCKYNRSGASQCLEKISSSQQYSSPYIFDNPNVQQCKNPYQIYNSSVNNASCLDLYPAVNKCPSASYCPTCPCGQIDQTITFNIDNPNDANSGASPITKKITGHDLVTGECNDYAYNTDPLTFYCRSTWEEQLPSSSKGSICSADNEIPVGQAVDDAKTWANNLTKAVDKYLEGIDGISKTIDKINKKKVNEYCRCDSKYDKDNKDAKKAGKPICSSNCTYNPPITGTDSDGNSFSVPPSCTLASCSGDSCQQMIDYMKELSDDYVIMKKAFIDLLSIFLKDTRTDPLKELTYSRQSMDSCSQRSVRLGSNAIATLSCTTAYKSNYLQSRCYGVLEGAVRSPQQDLTDNWFCCTEAIK